MKKFAFLFVIVSILYFADAAFAALDEYDVAHLEKSTAHESAMGNITGTDPQDGSPKIDGEYSAKIYWYGTIGSVNTAGANVKLTIGSAHAPIPKFFATTADVPAADAGIDVKGIDQDGLQLTLGSAAVVKYTFGTADDGDDPKAWRTGTARAVLTLTPTEVKIKELGTVNVQPGKTKTC